MAIFVNYKGNAKNKEEIDKMLKTFKRKVKESKLLKEVNERMFYTKPSEIKRKKSMISKHRAKMVTKRNNS